MVKMNEGRNEIVCASDFMLFVGVECDESQL